MRTGLLAQTEFLDQRGVAVCVLPFQVSQQALAPVHHLQQAAAAVVILQVGLEVRRQFVDAVGQQGDLDLGRTGVGRAAGVRLDDLGDMFSGGGHSVSMK